MTSNNELKAVANDDCVW